MFQRSRETRICYIVCCSSVLSSSSKFVLLFSLNEKPKRSRLFARWCRFRRTALSFPNACAEFVKPVKDAEKAWILKELKSVWLRSNLRYFVLGFRALKLLYNGRQYDKCGTRLHCIFKPAQMYLKIPNVSTFTRNPHLLYCLL
jgi:hypothetical protein